MEQKSLTTILAEKLGLDPAQNTDTRYQKLDILLKVTSDDDLTRFINKNIPATRVKDKQELLLHFKKYLRAYFTEEILKYYEKSFTNRAAQVNHCKTRISVYKETLQKQQHSDTCYGYFHVILEELSLIEKLISRVKSNNTPETPPQSQVTATTTTRTAVSTPERLQTPIEQTVFGLNFDFIGKLYDNLLIEGFVNESSTKEIFLQHFFVDTVPETRIVLHGTNQRDIGLLIWSLREFFKEDYQGATFFNKFWADRFGLQTKRDSQNPKTKKPNDISRIISEVKTGYRPPTKKQAIAKIVENLKAVPQ